MITRIPDDPFAGIQLPPLVVESMPVRFNPLNEVGVQIDRSDSLSAPIDSGDPSSGGGGGSVPVYPFQPTIVSNVATLEPGTLNGVQPSNIGSSFFVSATGTYYLVLSVSAVNGVISSSTLSVTASPPATIGVSIGYPVNTFDYPLYVFVNQEPFRLIGTGSLQAVATEAFRVQKSTPSPDLLPYDSYYTWTLTNV